jgi:KTSC domain
MKRTPLRAGKLKSAGFDDATRVMHIEFANGDVYEYKGVSPEVFRQLINTPSPASYFEDKIDEAYTGKRIAKTSNANAGAAFDDLFGEK